MYSNQYEEEYYYDPRAVAYRHLMIAMAIATVTIGLMTLFPVQDLLVVYSIGSIVEMGIIFLLFFAAIFRKQFSESTAVIILNVFAVASAITLGFMVNLILKYGDPAVVFLTFGIAFVTIFAIWGYTSTRKPDVSGMYKGVMIFAIVFILFSFLGMFLLADWPFFYLIVSGGGALLFAIFMYMDFARLERMEFNSPAMMALWLFYDIIFFIKYLLMFLMAASGMSRD